MSPAATRGYRVVSWTLRLALSGVFLYAGAVKMRALQSFAESVASFRLLPEVLITPVALLLPPMEILAAALALTGGRLRRSGAFCLLVLLGIFTLALESALVRGLHVDCGCFGADRFDALSPTGNLWTTLGRDLGLGVLAWALYAEARRREAPAGA